jgi:hypothetical protein
MFPSKDITEDEIFSDCGQYFNRDYIGKMETAFNNFEGDESVFWYESHPLTAYQWPFSTMALSFY